MGTPSVSNVNPIGPNVGSLPTTRVNLLGIDISLLQLANPSFEILADMAMIYQTPNGSLYQSNGTSLTSMNSGTSGTTGTIRVPSTTVIPLDTIGNGKAMPLVAGASISITADITPTIAAGSVLGGVCVVDYISSGTGNLVLTSFNARGDIFAVESGRLFTVTYYNQTSGAFAVVQKGNLLIPAPTFVSQTAPAGTVGTAYSYTFAALNTTLFAVASGTLPAGLTLNTSTGALTGTPTTAATSAFVISATGAGGTTNSTVQSVVVIAPTGVLSQVAYTPAATLNLTTTGVVDWVWARGSTSVNLSQQLKLGSSSTVVNTGTGTLGVSTGFSGYTVTAPDGSTSGDISRAQVSVAASTDTGFLFTIPISTTSRTFDFEYSMVGGPGKVTLTLGDASASVAPITVAATANGGMRITAKAGAATTLTVRFEANNVGGATNVIPGAITVY